MNRPDNLWTRAGTIAIIVFVLGKLLFEELFGFFEPHVDGIDFRIRELDRFVNTSTLFSIILFIFTLLVVLMWRVAPVGSTASRVISIIVILLLMMGGIVLRHFQVKNYFIR